MERGPVLSFGTLCDDGHRLANRLLQIDRLALGHIHSCKVVEVAKQTRQAVGLPNDHLREGLSILDIRSRVGDLLDGASYRRQRVPDLVRQ